MHQSGESETLGCSRPIPIASSEMLHPRNGCNTGPSIPPEGCVFDQLLRAVQDEHYRSLDALNKQLTHDKGSDPSSPRKSVKKDLFQSHEVCHVDGAKQAGHGIGVIANSHPLMCTQSAMIPPTEKSFSVSYGSEGQTTSITKERPKNSNILSQSSVHLWPVWVDAETVKACRVDKQLAKVLDRSFVVGQSKIAHEFAVYSSGSLSGDRSFIRRRRCCRVKRSSFTLPLEPESKFRMLWDTFGMSALLYDMYTIPLQVFEIEDVRAFVIGGWCVLLFWTLDIFMNFISGYIDRDGEIERHYAAISRRYMTTWLIPDVMIVGIEWLVVFLQAYMGTVASNAAAYARMSKFMRIARILRTVRMMRFAKLKDLLYAIQHRIDSEWMSIAYGLVTNVFILVTLNHATACGWVMMGNFQFDNNSWIKYYGFEGAKRITKYLCALHWSLTLFTPASMDVHAVNDGERAYTVVNLILAMVIFASFVSSVTAGFTRLRHIEAESIKQRFMLKKFLKQNLIPISLQARIVRYIDIARMTHKKRVSHDSVVLLDWLSGPLKVELRKELCSPFLFLHSFWFRYYATSHSALNEVCLTACSFISVSRGDTLFWRFSQSHHMCIVMSGSMVYRRCTKLPVPRFLRVPSRSYFCEQPLWVNWVHHGSMKALIETDYMSIDCQKFRDVSVCHHDVLKLACEYAKKYRADLEAAFIKFGSVWDLSLKLLNDQLLKADQMQGVRTADGGESEVTRAENVEAQLIEWSDDDVEDEDLELSIPGLPQCDKSYCTVGTSNIGAASSERVVQVGDFGKQDDSYLDDDSRFRYL